MPPCPQTHEPTGSVTLAGAGPGDPSLLTVAAHDAILAADLIVHDGLVDPRILDLGGATPRISVAKSRSRHTMRQEAINDLLVAEARRGKRVVRLKGGDPFVFGRGGEEVDACLAAGIAVRVIPGISAASGGAAAAMIPLTHRDVSSAVSFVAGQCKGLAAQDWSGLAGRGRTLVIYMGVSTATDIADKLITDGVAPTMPVAVIENATRPDSRILRTLLADLGDLILRDGVLSPAIIIVGEVAARGVAEDKLGMLASAAEAMA
ncbi:MAG: uroporphyrinogen-III C-methyltransferase [Sphingomonas sp.]|nr:uroporphyrinogen-III C-methyltransferase [Sphingomonas sp.]